MLNISYSSAIEVINFLILCLDLELIAEEEYFDLRKKLEHITNQLYGLCRNLKGVRLITSKYSCLFYRH